MTDNHLRKLAEGLVNCYEEAYKIYAPEVDRIILNKVKDIHHIEHTLDYILDIYTEKGFYLFLKLLLYYQEINYKGAKAYLEILKEDRQEEYQEFIKKYTK